MNSYYNKNSLLDDIKTAAETGAAIGRRAASMAGGLIGAAVGCLC